MVVIISYYLEEIDVLVDCLVIIDQGIVIVIGIFMELKDWVGGDRVIFRIKEFMVDQEVEKVS